MQTQWQEIYDVYVSDLSLREKYSYLYTTLHRICTEMVQGMAADYTDFFSRLQAVCRLTQYRLYGIDRFRWRARRVMTEVVEADKQEFEADFTEFIKAFAHFTDSELPQWGREMVEVEEANETDRANGDNRTNGANKPNESNKSDRANGAEELHKPHLASSSHSGHHSYSSAFRGVIHGIEGEVAFVLLRDFPDETPVQMLCNRNEHTLDALSRLEVGMQVSAANCIVGDDGTIAPELIIIDPDFLIDITSLTGCVKPYGDTALTYLMNKLSIDETTVPILLGSVANQFLDDLVNNPDASFRDSMRRVFLDHLLPFSANEGIDGNFFKECQQQFDNIKKTVHSLYADPNFIGVEGNVILEPTFFCPNLGIQGRFDFLQGDMKNVIELKSGKWDDFRQQAKEEHILQMVLYKEIMHQNLGIRQNDVGGHLFYSKYPYLQEQRTAREMVMRMMTLRNKIVLLEHMLKEGNARELIDSLTPDDFKTRAVSDNLWLPYVKPRLEAMLLPLQQMDDLTADYFYAFLQFLSREQFHSKVGDCRIDSTRGMASLWNADADTKQSNGDMLAGLQILDIERNDGIRSVRLLIPDNDELMPNFRIGDSVILYQRNNPSESAVTQQVIRCSVRELEPDTITLQLRFSQRGENIFPPAATYAVEHDFADSAMRSQFESLVRFVNAPKEKRDLLLGQRLPRYDETITLKGKYLNPQIDNIVLRAKQAQDYFLLVGPPGTGKTSVALRSMVEEFLAEGQSILLLSFTNRAVDEICEQLTCPFLRLGRELSCAPEYRRHLLPNLIDTDANRSDVRSLLTSTQVVCSTVSTMSNNFDLLGMRQFDVTIIDEASQILEPQIIGLLTRLGKFIMIGDHKQLPAVVVQTEEQSQVTSGRLHAIGLTNCRNSLFERLMHNCDAVHTSAFLARQGRMHPAIGTFASTLFYDGTLVPVPVQHQTEPLPYTQYSEDEEFVATTRFGFVDIPLPSVTERQPKLNQIEAQTIAGIVAKIMSVNVKNNIEFDPSRHLGIIVPFRRQIAAVRTALASVPSLRPFAGSIMIDTVERYQGSQRDVIIYGTTITRPYELQTLSNIVDVDGHPIDRKLNVAVTRARKQLFVVGNADLLRANPLYRLLIEEARTWLSKDIVVT